MPLLSLFTDEKLPLWVDTFTSATQFDTVAAFTMSFSWKDIISMPYGLAIFLLLCNSILSLCLAISLRWWIFIFLWIDAFTSATQFGTVASPSNLSVLKKCHLNGLAIFLWQFYLILLLCLCYLSFLVQNFLYKLMHAALATQFGILTKRMIPRKNIICNGLHFSFVQFDSTL